MKQKELQTEILDSKLEHNYVEHDDLHIIACVESDKANGENEVIEIYSPLTCLIYVEKGILHVESENESYNFHKGSIVFVRKYTHAFYSNIYSEKENYAKTYSFVMREDFIRKLIAKYKFNKNLEPITERIIKLDETNDLNSIITVLKSAVDNKDVLKPNDIEDYIAETFKAIIKDNPKLAVIFKEFSLAKRADLSLFMKTNYMLKLPINQLALMSGRSVSTFTREFKIIFNTTPHKWILKKRLQLGYKLLEEGRKNVSEINLEAGFEDLAHFSKAFKKEFGVNPSEIKQKIKVAKLVVAAL